MGYDCGFDLVPRLTDTEIDNARWKKFLDEIRQLYRDDPVFVIRPGFINFEIGEYPSLPLEGHKFLRFSSKVSGSLRQAEFYVRKVYRVARKHFNTRVQFWHELSESYGHYDWSEVNDSIRSYSIVSTQGSTDLGNNLILPSDNLENELSPIPQQILTSMPAQGSTSYREATFAGIAGGDMGEELKSCRLFDNDITTRPLYRIEEIAGKGLGVVATIDLQRGSRIVSERPSFAVFPNASEAEIGGKLRSLSKGDQRRFLTLHNNYPADKSPFKSIVRTNALPLGSGAAEGGIFLTCSRFNHSCIPNAQHTWNRDTGKETIHAVKYIPEGTEITIQYVHGPTKRRRPLLKDGFGFECTCDLCSLPDLDLALSDKRLEEIAHLDIAIGDGARLVSHPTACLADARKLYSLLKAENITDARVARLYYDAFQIVIAHGDLARAKVFAMRAYEERVICEGDDSPEAKNGKAVAINPGTHRSFQAASTKWKQSIKRIPEGLSSEEFETWLWTRRRRQAGT